MSVPNRQIGWSQESNLLWQLSKQFDRLISISGSGTSNIISILNNKVTNDQGVPSFYADSLANIPTAGVPGRMFISTDTYAFYRDNGAGWDLVGGPGTGTLTGSGTLNELSYFTGSSTIGSLSTATYPSLSELSYVKGVTSSVQTQLNSKVPTSRNLTINGTTYDLSADRSWTIPSDNIYNSDGMLTGNRTVTSGGYSLSFNGGNVGIGTTSPAFKLDVNSDVRFTSGITITAAVNTLYLANGTLSHYGADNGVYLNGPGANGFLRLNGAGTENGQNSIDVFGSAGNRIVFRTNNNERMRIFSSGNVLIGTTTDAGFKLDVNGTARVQGNMTFTESLLSTSSTGVRIVNTTNSNQPVIIGNSNTNNSNVAVLTTVVGTNNQLTASTVQGSIYGNANTLSVSTIAATVIGTNNTIQTGTMLEGQFAIGRFNIVSHTASSIIGTYQNSTGTNQLIFGLDRSNYTDAQVGYNDVYFGTGPRGVTRVSSTGRGTDVTINGSGAGNVTDAAGGFLRLAAGKSAGAGTPPDVIFATASATTSGTTLQTLTNRWWVKGGTGQLANVASPNASAQLQIDSTTRGFLPPRMTTTQRDAISTPATGLLIFNTTTNVLEFYDGAAWAAV